MVNKKSYTYKQIFGKLKEVASERGKTFSPALIITDFESGVLPVLKSEVSISAIHGQKFWFLINSFKFPNSKRMGCFYHFSQSVYRQIQSLGMQQQYAEDESLRCLCRKLMALALMPTDKVKSCFEEIQEDAYKLPDQPMDDLLEYFEDNWMNNINLWNVSESDVRTNNNCEGEESI